MCEESSLDAALGLRGMGANDLDVEVVHGARELSDGLLVLEFLFDGGLAVDLVDRVFVDVESDGTSPSEEVVAGGGEELERILNGDESAEKDFACGVVNEDQEHATRGPALEPVVVGTIELDELSEGWAALTPGAVLGRKSAGFVEALLDHSPAKDEGGQV